MKHFQKTYSPLSAPEKISSVYPGGSDGKASAYNAGNPGLIPGSGRSPGEGNGNPLQYSHLQNPVDRGAWWATVHGVTKSRTRLSDFTFTLYFHHWRRKWQPTPVFLPGESQGRRSLVGYRPCGRKESDTTERLHYHYHYTYCSYCSWGSQGKNTEVVCHSPFPVVHILSDLSTMTLPSWVAPRAWLSFLELDKAVVLL